MPSIMMSSLDDLAAGKVAIQGCGAKPALGTKKIKNWFQRRKGSGVKIRPTSVNPWDAGVQPDRQLTSCTSQRAPDNVHLDACHLAETISTNAEHASASLTTDCVSSQPEASRLASPQLSENGSFGQIDCSTLDFDVDELDQKTSAFLGLGRFMSWRNPDNKNVRPIDTAEDGLKTGNGMPHSAKTKLIQQDQEVTCASQDNAAGLITTQCDDDTHTLIGATLRASDSRKISISGVAAAGQIARDAITVSTATIEQNHDDQQAEPGHAAMIDSFNAAPGDTRLKVQEGAMAFQPSMHTATVVPTSAVASELCHNTPASEIGFVSDIAILPAGSNTAGCLPSAVQLLRRVFAPFSKAHSGAIPGDDVRLPQPCKGVAAARHCFFVAQSTCGNSPAVRNIASAKRSTVDVDEYLALKLDRDNVSSKLLATIEMLTKEQLLRQAAEADVASKCTLIEQLMAAQEALRQSPDLHQVPVSRLCSALGWRLMLGAADQLQLVGGTFITFAAKATAAVESCMPQQRKHSPTDKTPATGQTVIADDDAACGTNTIHWQSSLGTAAVQSLMSCLQAVTNCLMLAKAAASTAGHVVSNRTKGLARGLGALDTRWFAATVSLLILSAVMLLFPMPFAPRPVIQIHPTASVLRVNDQLCTTHSEQQMLARCPARHGDMAAWKLNVSTEVPSDFYSLYMGKMDLAIGKNTTQHSGYNNTATCIQEDALGTSPVVLQQCSPAKIPSIAGMSQDLRDSAASKQLAVTPKAFHGIITSAVEHAAVKASSTPAVISHACAPAAQLALAPPEGGISYQHFVATLTEQQRTWSLLESLPKPPASTESAVLCPCRVTVTSNMKAAVVLPGLQTQAATATKLQLPSVLLGHAGPMASFTTARPQPAVQAPSHINVAALLAHTIMEDAAVSKQLIAVGKVFDGIIIPTVQQAAASPSSTSAIILRTPAVQLGLPPSQSDTSYEQFVAALTEQQRTQRFLDSLPKPPSITALAVVHPCNVTANSNMTAAVSRAGLETSVVTATTLQLLPIPFGNAGSMLSFESTRPQPALQAPNYNVLSALSAHFTQLAGLENAYQNMTQCLLNA